MSAPSVAQVGCGHWGKNLARNFAEFGALGAIVDEHDATAARLVAEHGAPRRSFDDVLADPVIDAIAFATPASTHAELATRAIAAGKHVYVEKPLALDVDAAERLIRDAEDKARVLMVGHLLQYNPIFRRLADLVASGELGNLLHLSSSRLSFGKFRLEENVLWSFAPHDFSMILSLVGEEPERVSAQGAAYVTPGLADWCSAQMTFPSGARAQVQASWLHPFKEHKLVVVGDQAMAVFEDSAPDWRRKLAIFRHKLDHIDGTPVAVRADADYVDVERSEPLRDECRHFLDCVAGGGKPRTDGAEGLAVLRALDRAQAALTAYLDEP